MKKNLLLLFALACGMQSIAINFVLERTDATQESQDIAAIGKWLFVNGGTDLQLLANDGTVLATESLKDIRKITFSASDLSAVENALTEGRIVVFPNPTYDLLVVKGAGEQTLRVFDQQGHLLRTVETNEIPVNDLADGTYLLQIGTQVVRFIKQ